MQLIKQLYQMKTITYYLLLVGIKWVQHLGQDTAC